MEGLAATDLAGSKTGLIAQVKVKAKASEVAITRDAGDVGAGDELGSAVGRTSRWSFCRRIILSVAASWRSYLVPSGSSFRSYSRAQGTGHREQESEWRDTPRRYFQDRQ